MTEHLKQEAYNRLAGYIGSDINTNIHMRLAFMRDLNELIQEWDARGIAVNADNMPHILFSGMTMTRDGELMMCWRTP